MTGFDSKRRMAADKLQEPVVQPAPGYCKNCKNYTIEELLYAQPAQERPWVGLTIDEKDMIVDASNRDVFDAMTLAEAKLKEKNT
jgi:hypothetical protein